MDDLFKCLANFLRNLRQILAKEGKVSLKEEIVTTKKTKKNQKEGGKEGDFISFVDKGILYLWDGIMQQLDDLIVALEKGNKQQILISTRKLAESVTHLQQMITMLIIEVGSFVPGPVGIVCSVVLSVTCFLRCDIAGGFMNLLGIIPFGKCAKFLPKNKLKSMLINARLNKFYPINTIQEVWLNIYENMIKRYSNNFMVLFEKSFKEIPQIKPVASNQKINLSYKSEYEKQQDLLGQYLYENDVKDWAFFWGRT